MSTQPGTSLAPRDAARELANTVRGPEFKSQVAIALPEGVNPDRFVRIMATALLDNPDIAAKADLNSVFQAGLKAAQDGLLPDGREAAFVLFKDRCAYLPMVGGFRKIAAEFGWSLRSAVVYANDVFDFALGLDPKLTHIPTKVGDERGDARAAYAVATHKDGRKEFAVMTAAEIEQVRQTSRAKDHGPWKDWPDLMWQKSVVRRLFKTLPLAEADRARIERVLSATELGPEGAARELYGPTDPDDDRVRIPAIPPAPDSQPAVDAGAISRGGEEESQPPAAAASAPEFDGEEPPAEAPRFVPPAGATEQAAPSQADLAAAGAGEIRFTSGRYSGMTVRQVLEEHGDRGRDYLAWCATKWKTEPIRSAVRTYLAAAAPELLS